MIMDDNDGQMIFGDLGGLKLLDICLTGEEKPQEKPHPGNLYRPEIEPEPTAGQAHMLPPVPQRWTAQHCVGVCFTVIISADFLSES